ncbi:MAG: SCO family protein [Polyangiales bacterium]
MADAPALSAERPTLRQILRARPWLLAPWIALLLALPAVAALKLRRKPVPVYFELPAWQLTDQTARPYGTAELRGHPYVANFIFTSCPFSCPRLTRHMRRVQDGLAREGSDVAAVRMVSFTVDPEVDTPERLARYAREYGADAARWRFVTGPTPAIQRLSVDGFKLAMGEPPAGRPQGYNILHGEFVMLVDGRGRIRGYYRADDDGLRAIVRDAESVAREPAP